MRKPLWKLTDEELLALLAADSGATFQERKMAETLLIMRRAKR